MSYSPLMDVGKQVLLSNPVQNSVSQLASSTAQGAAQVGLAAGSVILGTAPAASLGVAVGSVGSSVAAGAAAVGGAIVAVATSPLFLGAAAIGLLAIFLDD